MLAWPCPFNAQVRCLIALSDSYTPAYTVHPGTGPYLVLLHGFLSSSRQWLHNLSTLSAVCQPITVDLYGHGASPAPITPEAYLPESYICALERLRCSLGIQHWFVAGYSLGAGIAIRYAYQHPHRVLAHVFTNSASAFADNNQVTRWRQDAVAHQQRILQNGLAAVRRIPVHPRFAKRLPADLYDLLTEDARSLSPLAVAQTLSVTTPNACIRPIAALNPRPALLCYGQLEKRFEPYKVWAERHMVNLSVTTLQAGHAVNMEDSNGFNHAVTQFIRQHTP